MTRTYKATKSRSKGRAYWAVIFRHPTRIDPSTGSPGRRIRRGLGTPDELEADRLVGQLNELLADRSMWETTARFLAEALYDDRVAEIFYDGAESSRTDFAAIRQNLLPLPTAADGYPHVLLLGTTGAGKTTVVRQLLGTDPLTERFPSTSTAKTTIADTEIVVGGSSSYEAVVTFASHDEIVDSLAENLVEAAIALVNARSDDEVLRRLLDHVNQRHRFSYILGRGTPLGIDEDDDFDDDEDVTSMELIDPSDFGDIDMAATAVLLSDCLSELRMLVHEKIDAVRRELGPASGDERAMNEIIEEEIQTRLHQAPGFHQIIDKLIDEMELRFRSLSAGELRKNRQGWPVSWSWATEDRGAFLKTIMRFSSNQAALFGSLITPLVNGVRVSGPFQPEWMSEAPRLVILDGEGLGHTPGSASTLSTDIAKQVETVDSVILVDNAQQPMQAAPLAAMKSLAVSGNATKLFLLFTHFDLVKGQNMPKFQQKEEHILASAENVLEAIGDELGPIGERALRRRLEDSRFFVGNIQGRLEDSKKSHLRSRTQLEDLLTAITEDRDAVQLGSSRPVYDRMNLSLAVTAAAKAFHMKWKSILGLKAHPEIPKEPWQRIKALTRRLATGMDDHYDSLMPVADLRNQLQIQLYVMLQQPVTWGENEPNEDEKQAIVEQASNAITAGIFKLTERRLIDEVQLGWHDSYILSGPGSTFERARHIEQDVYDRGVPIPTVAATRDQNNFLTEVAQMVSDVAEKNELVFK